MIRSPDQRVDRRGREVSGVVAPRRLTAASRSAAARLRERHRRLGLESLEARRLLTTASVTQLFRSDEYTLAGTFAYALMQSDYRDSIPSGQYSGTGSVTWLSPTEGSALFEGVATGAGSDQFLLGGIWRNCSSYRIRDEGMMFLTIDAGTKDIIVDGAAPISTTYTQYTDLTGGSCPAGDPKPIYFGGNAESYSGSFDPVTHKATVTYSDPSQGITVNSPAATVTWTNTASTDMVLSLAASNGTPPLPEGWLEIPQSLVEPDNSFLDPVGGLLEITVAVNGKPPLAPASGALTPVGNITLAWASNSTPTATIEVIPIDTASDTVGVFWNTDHTQVVISNLPTAPAWAEFVRVTVAANGFTETNTANNVGFLPLKQFVAGDGATDGISEDDLLIAFDGSVLSAGDLARYPEVTVFAHAPESRLGAGVFITDDRGGFAYDPTGAPALQALAEGQTTVDIIDFLALEFGSFASFAEHHVTVVGVNDAPTAMDDLEDTFEDQILFIEASQLLVNDFDIDQGDSIQFLTVDDAGSLLGAAVQLLPGGIIRYDPTNAELLRRLDVGETLTDSFAYLIVDELGLESLGIVTVEVRGNNSPPEVLPVQPVVLKLGDASGQTVVKGRDWETEPALLDIEITSETSPLLAPSGVVVEGTGDTRTVTLTPTPGLTGRARLTAQVTTPAPENATATGDFFLIVGTTDDPDLDGVPSSVESVSPDSGDANLDGLPDSLQSHVTALPTADSQHWVWLTATTSTALSQVRTVAPAAATGTAAGATFPWGATSFEAVVAPGGSARIFIRSDSTAPINTYYQWVPTEGGEPGAGEWSWLGWNGNDGAITFVDHVELLVKDGGRGDADGQVNGVIVVQSVPARVNAPWQNRNNPLDVDFSGDVVPRDALLVINYLNSSLPKTLPTEIASGSPQPDFLDVFADNVIAPLDALLVVNRLNGVDGEGERNPVDIAFAEDTMLAEHAVLAEDVSTDSAADLTALVPASMFNTATQEPSVQRANASISSDHGTQEMSAEFMDDANVLKYGDSVEPRGAAAVTIRRARERHVEELFAIGTDLSWRDDA